MIILEGPDGAGKTTLLLNLLDEFPSIEQHAKASTSTGGPVENVHEWAKIDLETWGVQPLSFYDRHPMISEPFYGRVLRNHLDNWFFTKEAAKLGTKMLKSGFVVFCLPSLETVTENLKAEEQLDGVEDHISVLHAAYTEQSMMLSETFPANFFVYDYTRENDYDELLSVVEAHQVRWNRKQNGIVG